LRYRVVPDFVRGYLTFTACYPPFCPIPLPRCSALIALWLDPFLPYLRWLRTHRLLPHLVWRFTRTFTVTVLPHYLRAGAQFPWRTPGTPHTAYTRCLYDPTCGYCHTPVPHRNDCWWMTGPDTLLRFPHRRLFPCSPQFDRPASDRLTDPCCGDTVTGYSELPLIHSDARYVYLLVTLLTVGRFPTVGQPPFTRLTLPTATG